MRIPEHTVEQIRQAMDIVEVVSDYLALKKRGANYWALSPFKTEKTPSFSISPQKGIFKDFSSGKGGDAITFLMEVEGFSYIEALQHLARKYGIAIEADTSDAARDNDDVKASLYALNKFATTWFAQQLRETEEGRTIGMSYLAERGFSMPALEKFQIGYSPESWTALTDAAQRQQYKRDYLIQSGLSIQSDKDPARVYDRFRGRVIFPIHDAAGRIAGFGGRILKRDTEAAKYVNSPESPVYNKSAILYGLYQARQALRESGECILVEGYADVVSLHQAGVTNVVASSGTSLTPQQLQLIGRYARTVIIIYDADSAGIKAALRGIDLALESGLGVRALHLPDQHDPDSYVRTLGGTAFKEYLATNAQDPLAFKLNILRAEPGAKTPEKQTALVYELARTVALLADEITRSLYVRRMAEALAIGEQLFLNAVNHALTERARQQRNPAVAPIAQRTQTDPPPAFTEDPAPTEGPEGQVAFHDTYFTELELIRLLLNHAEGSVQPPEAKDPYPLADYVLEEIKDVPFHTPLLEQLRSRLLSAHTQQQPAPIHALLTESGPDVNTLIVNLLNFPYEIMQGWQRLNVFTPIHDEDLTSAATNAVLHFKLKRLAQLERESIDEIRRAQADSVDADHMARLQKRHIRLLELRRQVTETLGIVVLRI